MASSCVGRNHLWRLVTRRANRMTQARCLFDEVAQVAPAYRRVPDRIADRNRKLWPVPRRSNLGTTNRRASKTPISAAAPASEVGEGARSTGAADEGAITGCAGANPAVEVASPVVPLPAPSAVAEREGISGLSAADATEAMFCTSREPRIEPNVPA